MADSAPGQAEVGMENQGPLNNTQIPLAPTPVPPTIPQPENFTPLFEAEPTNPKMSAPKPNPQASHGNSNRQAPRQTPRQTPKQAPRQPHKNSGKNSPPKKKQPHPSGNRTHPRKYHGPSPSTSPSPSPHSSPTKAPHSDHRPKYKAEFCIDLKLDSANKRRESIRVVGDTGCSKSAVSEEFFLASPHLQTRPYRPLTTRGTAINGSKVLTLGIVNVAFRINGRFYNQNMRVVRGLVQNIFLGWDCAGI